jgi:pSer/pThr/pTyr-binding forkhead associated (FHA) protein
MIKCPFCQAAQVENTIYCNECGQYLLEDNKRKTDLYDANEVRGLSETPDRLKDKSPFQLDITPVALRLKIGSDKREVEVPLAKTVTLGRVDPALDLFPEVDLTHDGPQAKSVSRRHAVIVRQDNTVIVEDLGSVNGTFINGKRLDPYLPESLSDGDTLQLGKILIKVEIKKR